MPFPFWMDSGDAMKVVRVAVWTDSGGPTKVVRVTLWMDSGDAMKVAWVLRRVTGAAEINLRR